MTPPSYTPLPEMMSKVTGFFGTTDATSAWLKFHPRMARLTPGIDKIFVFITFFASSFSLFASASFVEVLFKFTRRNFCMAFCRGRDEHQNIAQPKAVNTLKRENPWIVHH